MRISVALLIIGQAISAHAASLDGSYDIPIGKLSERPQTTLVVVSPDGQQIAATHKQGDRYQILIKDLGNTENAPSLVDISGYDVIWLQWASNERLVVGAIKERGWALDGYFLFAMKNDGSDLRHLLRPSQVGRIIDILPNDPERVLAEVWNSSNPRYPGVYKLGIGKDRKQWPVYPGRSNITNWLADEHGNVRVGMGFINRTLRVEVLNTEGNWVRVSDRDFFSEQLFWPLAIGQSDILYILSRHDDDKAGLYEYDLNTQKIGELLYRNARVDIDDVELSTERKLLVANFTLDKPERYYFDGSEANQGQAIDRALPDTWNSVSSRSHDGNTVIVFSQSDIQPGRFFAYDKLQNSLTYIASKYPGLETYRFAKTKEISYKARDDMTLFGFVTVPEGASAESLPMVVLVHGGPRSRSSRSFHYWVQFLASRGYVVFQPNFRGSTGYGAEYERKGYEQWGRSMQDDVTDGILYLINQEIADKERVCIMGASYGGYSALMGVVRSPKLIKCAVSYAGISNINNLMAQDRYSMANRVLIGQDFKTRRENSPLAYVKDINQPILLAHGKRDDVVNFSQSSKMYKALKRAKKDVRFLKFKKENHYLIRDANRLEFLTAVQEFLAEHLPANH